MSIYPVGFVALEDLKSLHNFIKEEIFKKKPPAPLSEFPTLTDEEENLTDEEFENLTAEETEKLNADWEEVKREVERRLRRSIERSIGERFKPSLKEKEGELSDEESELTDEEIENLTDDYEEVERSIGESIKPSPKEKEIVTGRLTNRKPEDRGGSDFDCVHGERFKPSQRRKKALEEREPITTVYKTTKAFNRTFTRRLDYEFQFK
jgi:hypothetical protein